jgi:hypothetical protein
MTNFFCSAKWNELYLYLNHGLSNSCSHPIPHQIPLDELKETPFALHNTVYKMEQQSLMLKGERPRECHMCWHIEDSNPDTKSDRHMKNARWGNTQIFETNINYVPKFIEVVFDNLCNLSCSYCDSGQSSTWAKILKTEGPFNLQTDYRNLYQKVHIAPGSTKQEYLDAWNKWWPQIKDQIEVLKVSGGEPLISPNFWNTADALSNDNSSLTFRINSNLSVNQKYVERFANLQDKIKELGIAASIDATGHIAEFARMGLDYKLFLENVKWYCENTGDNCKLNLQSTVNIFSVWGFKDKLNLSLELRAKYGKKITDFYSTVVRFPEFQSVLLLPEELRIGLGNDLENWLTFNKSMLNLNEILLVKKIINYLIAEPKMLTDLDRQKLLQDVNTFTQRYEKLSKKPIDEVYGKSFVNWLKSPK